MDAPTMFLLAFCVSLSAISIGLSWYALGRSEKSRLAKLEKLVGDLDFAVIGLNESYESVRKSVKRMNSRYAMREKRANTDKAKSSSDSDMPDPKTDPQGWRDAIQRKYPKGVFSIIGR